MPTQEQLTERVKVHLGGMALQVLALEMERDELRAELQAAVENPDQFLTRARETRKRLREAAKFAAARAKFNAAKPE